MIKSVINIGFKWKQSENSTDGSIGSLYIWYEHDCRVSCKGLDINEGDSHAQNILIIVLWQHGGQSRKISIGVTLLKLQDDSIDGIHDFLGDHGGITDCNRRGCGGSGCSLKMLKFCGKMVTWLKLEGVVLEEASRFGGPGWYRLLDTACEE